MKLIIITVFFFVAVSITQAQEENCANQGCHATLTEHENIHPALEEGCLSCHDQSGNNHPKGKGPEFKLTEE